MIVYLINLLVEKFSFLNLFHYLTVRSMMSFFTAFFIALFIAPKFISYMKAKKLGQFIREDGPQNHLKKGGTPTMGGLFVSLAILISSLLWTSYNALVFLTLGVWILFTLVGFIDDYKKFIAGKNEGLTSRSKFLLQVVFATFIVMFLYFTPSYHLYDNYALHIQADDQVITYNLDSKEKNISLVSLKPNTNIIFTLFHKTVDDKEFFLQEFNYENISPEVILNISAKNKNLCFHIVDDNKVQDILINRSHSLFQSFYFPFFSEPLWQWPLALAFLFYIFTLVAFSNATNLSDGLDGLAAGMSISLYIPFGIFAYLIGNELTSTYLLFPYIPGAGEIAVILAAVVGAMGAFLWYNVYPAEIFLGDTASLAIGATIAFVAILLKQEVALVIAGFMFVLETFSVVLQVFVYKRCKKRIFLMAPLHHHFEMKGWKETQIVARFWILSALFSILALSILKIR